MLDFPAYDNTPTINVKIHDNTFKNKYRAVGSHHAVPGKRYENIRFYSNTLTNIGGKAVNAVYWFNSYIYNNKLTDVGSGIDYVAFDDHNMYNVNKLSHKEIVAQLQESSCYIYGNTVTVRSKNNKIDFKFGIRARGTNNEKAKNNIDVESGIYRLYNAHLGVDNKGKKSPNKVSGLLSAGVELNYANDSEMCYNSVNLNKATAVNSYGLFVWECEGALIKGNKSAVTGGETSIQRSGATIRAGKDIEFCDNTISVPDYGIQHMYGATNVKIHDNNITSERSNCVYYTGADDTTPGVRKSMSIYNNTFSALDSIPGDASIRIQYTKMDVTAYGNGEHLIRLRGSDDVDGKSIITYPLSGLTATSVLDGNRLEWDYYYSANSRRLAADSYKVYRISGGVEDFLGETEDCEFFDQGAGITDCYRVVPVCDNGSITLSGEFSEASVTVDIPDE